MPEWCTKSRPNSDFRPLRAMSVERSETDLWLLAVVISRYRSLTSSQNVKWPDFEQLLISSPAQVKRPRGGDETMLARTHAVPRQRPNH